MLVVHVVLDKLYFGYKTRTAKFMFSVIGKVKNPQPKACKPEIANLENIFFDIEVVEKGYLYYLFSTECR